MKEEQWGKIDNGRLDGSIVRDRNIAAFNDSIKDVIGSAFGMSLPEVDITMVRQFEEYSYVLNGNGVNNNASVSTAIYLALEDAVATSTDTLDIPLSALENITDMSKLNAIFKDVKLDMQSYVALRDSLGKYLTSTPVLKGMCKVYALFKVGNGMSVHPTPAGHDDIAQAVINAYDSGYTAADKTLDNLEWAANTLYALAREYYDDAYAYAYAYAKDAGYIDIAVNSICSAQNELDALINELAAMEMTPEFHDEMLASAQEINAALSTAAALLTAADQLDQETLEAALALLAQAETASRALLAMAEQAGADSLDLVVLPALEQINAKFGNEIIPAVKQAAEEIYQKAYDYLMNYAGDDLQEAFDALADALVNKAQEIYPQIADWVYNYLYENPDKVIAFINEYGDDAVTFLSQYTDEIMAVVGYVATNYGWDIVVYIVDNADTILATMVSWVQTHGENAWNLIKVYLAELGLLDYLPTQAEIEAAIAMVQSIIDECYAQLNGTANEMLAQLEALLPVLEQQVLELQKQVEVYAQMLNAQMKAQLNAAIAELNAALAELEQAAEELRYAVENQLDTLVVQLEQAYEEALADAQAALKQLKTSFDDAAASVRDAIEELYDALNEYQDMIADLAVEAVDALNKALVQLENTLNEYADWINAEVLPQLMQQVEEIAKQLAELEDLLRNYTDAGVEEVTAQLQVIMAQLQNSINDLIATAEGQVDKAVAEAIAAFEMAYLSATTADYDVTNESYYVAIGDCTLSTENSYADLLANALDIPYNKIYTDDLTAAGALQLIKGSPEAQSQIYQSDLVTLGFSHNTIVDFMLENVSDFTASLRTPLDWSVFGISGLEENVETVLAELQTALNEKINDANTSAMLTIAIESYVYAYASHLASYPVLAEAVHKINPDTLVVLVGMSNAFDGVVLTLNSEEIALGEYVQYLVGAANIEALAYAMISGNSDTLLRLESVTAFYADTPACQAVSLEVRQGERIALRGKNGCGKSTILKLICGKELHFTGELYKASGLVISYVSQETNQLSGSLNRYAEQCGIDQSLFKTILRKLGFLRDQFSRDIWEFSAGQKKKVLLARSLCQQAHLYVWDEPLNYIDVLSRMQIEELLLRFQPTLLFVEHDKCFCDRVASRIVELE